MIQRESAEPMTDAVGGISEQDMLPMGEARPEIGEEDNEWMERYLAEAEGVRAVYPNFDPTAELAHPVMGAILRGEAVPTLRQLYEAVHLEEIAEGRVAARVQAEVSEAVDRAVREAVAAAERACEERLLGHIRARGRRPAEVGMSAAAGVRMHPAVNRLTRRERAMLAKRAEDGETIKL